MSKVEITSRELERINETLSLTQEALKECVDALRTARHSLAETNALNAALVVEVASLKGARRVRHKRRGSEYHVLGEASLQVKTVDTITGPGAHRWMVEGEKIVVYKDVVTGRLWCRPKDEFEDGRFEDIT